MKPARYGASALHLLVHLAGFGFCLFVLAQVVRGGAVVSFAVWFVGAALLHDLVLLPLYSLVDRLVRRLTPIWDERSSGIGRRIPDERSSGIGRRPTATRPPLVNHLRVPGVISGVLLLVYFPEVLRLSERRYRLASAHPLSDYAARWVAIAIALFALSGLVYALRVWRTRR